MMTVSTHQVVRICRAVQSLLFFYVTSTRFVGLMHSLEFVIELLYNGCGYVGHSSKVLKERVCEERSCISKCGWRLRERIMGKRGGGRFLVYRYTEKKSNMNALRAEVMLLLCGGVEGTRGGESVSRITKKLTIRVL